jgi:hypothetical protein
MTDLYVPIYLVRLDKRTNHLIVLAGDEIEMTIKPNGSWEFLP